MAIFKLFFFFCYNSAKPEWNFMGKAKGTSLASGHRRCQNFRGCLQTMEVSEHLQSSAGDCSHPDAPRPRQADINPQCFKK